jgi:dihydrofolate synthase/folylpolyglutamate synthase
MPDAHSQSANGGDAGYNHALENILALDKFGSRLGLARIRRMLRLLGNPHKCYKCIVVGGSNGKGSTVEMIGNILSRAGYKTGTYFSPQIESFPERFRINGKNASKREIASAYFEVKKACKGIDATFFEVVTAMAFLIFKKRKVDYAVLEVGLGGRLDAVNACDPAISAITTISLEHTDVLGNTIEKIASEKCRIARKGRVLVCGECSRQAINAVLKECKKIGAQPIFAAKEVKIAKAKRRGLLHSFCAVFGNEKYNITLSAPGEFQVSNACVALALCAKLGIKKEAIEEGLAHTLPFYRLQKIGASPLTIADCAHNPQAASALAKEISKIRGKKPRVLLFSAMKDKDYASVLSILAPQFDTAVICEVGIPRCAGLQSLFLQAKKAFSDVVAIKDAKRALRAARRIAGKDGLLAIAGSIYLLGELYGKDKRRVAQ